MEQERETDKLFTYLCLGLGLIAVLLLVFKVVLKPKTVVLPSFESLKMPVVFDLDLIRKPLAVNLPVLDVSLTANPKATSTDSWVGLSAEVKGATQGPFVYKFDCQNDGTFELTTEATFQKRFDAPQLCFYSKEGSYQAQVAVDGFFDYFQNGQEVKEKKTSQAQASIVIGTTNIPPEFVSCDVDSVEGTTQTNFKFSFTSQAQDLNGDEIRYEWDFGDGTKMEGQNIIYSYKKMGLFVPTVKATDSKGASAVCVAKSLTVLKGLSAFAPIPEPARIGRQDPFSVYKPGEQSLIAYGAGISTSTQPKKVVATSTTTGATSTLSSTSTKP